MGDGLSKPGAKTTEFYLALLNNIVGVLVLLGYLTPKQADDFVQAVIAVMGGVLVIISTGVYIWGRVQIKRQQAQSSKSFKGLLPQDEPGAIDADNHSGKTIPY